MIKDQENFQRIKKSFLLKILNIKLRLEIIDF